MKNKLPNITARIAIGLMIAEVVLIVASWVVAAAMPEAHVRSVLSNEGIRWFFGTLTSNLLTPLLVWLLFVIMAAGTVRASGLLKLRPPLTYRQRFALRIVLMEVAVALVVVLLLTALPHAVLLSATGHLFPSSFSDSLVPTLCVAAIVFAISYGLFAGTFKNFTEAIGALTHGIASSGSIWLIYLLLVELAASIRFVLT